MTDPARSGSVALLEYTSLVLRFRVKCARSFRTQLYRPYHLEYLRGNFQTHHFVDQFLKIRYFQNQSARKIYILLKYGNGFSNKLIKKRNGCRIFAVTNFY